MHAHKHDYPQSYRQHYTYSHTLKQTCSKLQNGLHSLTDRMLVNKQENEMQAMCMIPNAKMTLITARKKK